VQHRIDCELARFCGFAVRPVDRTTSPVLPTKETPVRAVTVLPKQAETVGLTETDEPGLNEGSVLVECVAVGVCGTDVEIVEGKYGWAPEGHDRLVLGHESLGRVLDPGHSDFAVGDLVAGIVRRPDPEPCPNCAVGEWDFCRNGKYTERGIKSRHGFMSERWRIEPEFTVKLDPTLGILGVLMEPTTVVAKAWEQVDTTSARAFWDPRTVLITGAGPIGLLATLIGVQRGLDVHVLDRVTDGPKPGIVKDLGATYHSTSALEIGFEPDVIIECTGVGQVISDSMSAVSDGGVVCLTGVGSGGRTVGLPLADVATEMVLGNNAIIGSVNANKRHFYKASQVLAGADRDWLSRLVTRREPPERFAAALERGANDIKTVVQFSDI